MQANQFRVLWHNDYKTGNVHVSLSVHIEQDCSQMKLMINILMNKLVQFCDVDLASSQLMMNISLSYIPVYHHTLYGLEFFLLILIEAITKNVVEWIFMSPLYVYCL